MNRTLEEIKQQKLDYVKAEKREFKQYIPPEQTKDKTSFIEQPPVQGYTGATPPPPPVQGYAGATPPPPPVQGYAGATPPPIEQTTQKFAEMSPKEQGKAILSMRKGINPLLPKVTDVSSITNTQTKTLSQTQEQSMSSIINSYSSRDR